MNEMVTVATERPQTDSTPLVERPQRMGWGWILKQQCYRATVPILGAATGCVAYALFQNDVAGGKIGACCPFSASDAEIALAVVGLAASTISTGVSCLLSQKKS